MEGLLLNSNLLGSSIFGAGGINIKSIQRGESFLPGLSSGRTVTISSVNVDNTIVRINLRQQSGSGGDDDSICIKLWSPTTIRINRSEENGDVYFFYEVIEFKGVKSKQTGETQITSQTQDVTINSVNVEKSLVFASKRGGGTDYIFGYHLLNSTTLRLTNNTTSGHTIYWQVIEFK
jgi:hypothetical protein